MSFLQVQLIWGADLVRHHIYTGLATPVWQPQRDFSLKEGGEKCCLANARAGCD